MAQWKCIPISIIHCSNDLYHVTKLFNFRTKNPPWSILPVWNQGILQGNETDSWRISIWSEKVPPTGSWHLTSSFEGHNSMQRIWFLIMSTWIIDNSMSCCLNFQCNFLNVNLAILVSLLIVNLPHGNDSNGFLLVLNSLLQSYFFFSVSHGQH